VNKLKLEHIYNPIFLKRQIVKKSGNGAVVYVDKEFIGKEAIVIIEEDKSD